MKVWIVRKIWIDNIFVAYIDKIFLLKENAEIYVQNRVNSNDFDILEMEAK